MRITFLGTGDAFGSGGRHPVSVLVRADSLALLLDCGPAALPMMKRLGYSPGIVDWILISHHHGDHICGLPFLLLEYHYHTARESPLTVAGPPGTGQKLRELTRLLFPGLESKPRGFEVLYRDVHEGEAERHGPLEVTPFRVRHFPEGVSFGYQIRLDGRTVVYSGDTEWTDELANYCAGSDLFICECSTYETGTALHMSYRQLLEHRHEIGARRTMLLHAGDDVLARRSDLAFELAEDGLEIDL